MFEIRADGTLEPMRDDPSEQLPDGIDYEHINDVEAAILKAAGEVTRRERGSGVLPASVCGPMTGLRAACSKSACAVACRSGNRNRASSVTS